jgi:hypothetical protein
MNDDSPSLPGMASPSAAHRELPRALRRTIWPEGGDPLVKSASIDLANIREKA